MLFSILTALVVVVGMTIVGILLVSALMIVPVATAHLLRVGFKATMAWAVVFSILSVLIGLTSSFYLDIAPGGTIVMTAVLMYIATMAVKQCINIKEKWGTGTSFSPGNKQHN